LYFSQLFRLRHISQFLLSKLPIFAKKAEIVYIFASALQTRRIFKIGGDICHSDPVTMITLACWHEHISMILRMRVMRKNDSLEHYTAADS
jgi:hypothetical protein